MINFDSFLTHYTTIGYLLVLISYSVFFKFSFDENLKGKAPFLIWPILFFLVLVFIRYPFLSYNQELEVDESQMLAQALSLKNDLIYWKSVDGTTQGPLTIYFLIIPTLLGISFDYTMARMLGLLVLSATLALIYLTFQNFFSRKTAILIFAPIGLFYLLSMGYFSALCNEYLVLFLLAICFWLFSLIYKQTVPTRTALFLLSFVSGMIPFAKLQGVPTAIFITLFTTILILVRSKTKIKDLLIFCLGGISFPSTILLLVYYFGVYNYFWDFYIIGNMEHSGGGTLLERLALIPSFLNLSGQFIFLLFNYFILFLVAFWILIKYKVYPRLFSNFLFYFSFSHFIVAVYAILKSGYFFQHYLQFLIIPLGLLIGVVTQISLEQINWNKNSMWRWSIMWLIICFSPHAYYKAATILGRWSIHNPMISKSDLGKPVVISPVSKEISKHIEKGDAITIWGWKPSYHIETKAPQGTADVMIYRLITIAPKQKDYIQKYLKDLKRTRPVVFVDEVNSRSIWFDSPETVGHEHISEIKDFVAQNYSLISTIENERIYVRNDRLSSNKTNK